MRYLLCIVLFVSCGCTVGPDYRQPEIDPGYGWSIEAEEQLQAEITTWWKQFKDPVLNRLVEQAVLRNLDIRQAIARVEEARTRYAFTSGEKYPAVGASGSITRRRQSENGPLPINRIPELERDQTIYEIGFDAHWEADLFGGTRRAIEAADARLSEAEELRRDVQITIIAEVVRRYVDLRNAQRELKIRQQLVSTAQQTYDLVQAQLQSGEVAEFKLAQADVSLKSQLAELPVITSEIQTSALAIGLLLADLPESQLTLAEQDSQPFELITVPVGIRADVLRRRPDIRAAERRLAASTAEIGQATAELFPKLLISGSGGFEALSSGNLFETSSQNWFIAPILSWRIFDGGRIKAQIRTQETVTKRLALAYEKKVLEVLSESEQALTRYTFGLESLNRKHETVAAAELNFDYAQSRYEQGEINLLELLDAQESVFTSRVGYTRQHRQAATSLISLYKALGGGWQDDLSTVSKTEVSLMNK